MNLKRSLLFSTLILILLAAIWGMSGVIGGQAVQANQDHATRTPEPTLTTAEQTEFRAYLLDELRSAFGFDDPLFEELAESYTLSSSEYITRLQDGYFVISIAATQFSGQRFVVGSMPSAVFGSRNLLFFRIDPQDNVIRLEPELSLPKGYNVVWLTDLNDRPKPGQIISDGFADRNQNQLPDLPLYWSTGGNCCPQYMLLLELNEQGEFVDITPSHADVSPARFFDLDQNGVWEIQGVNSIGSGGYAPQLVRWFGWDGSQYIEVTARHQDWYQKDIEPFLEYLGDHSVCVLLPALQADPINVYQVLLDYYAMGRLDEGWAEIQRRSNWPECKAQLMSQHESEIIAFEDWLLSLREGTLIGNRYSPVLTP